MTPETTFIYALCKPGTRTVRYIGKADNPKKRLKRHLTDSVKIDNHLGRWLRKILGSGNKPELIVLREVPYREWQRFEKDYIRISRALKIKLVNGCDGGIGGSNPCQEARVKMSAARSGPKHWLFGKPQPEETKKKISDTLTGRKGHAQSEETRLKLHLAHVGRPKSPEHCAKLGLKGAAHPFYGQSLSEEHCSNISKALTGHIKSEEHCANLSLAKLGSKNPNFGKKPSKETIAKRTASLALKRDQISASLKAAWARRKAIIL